jgi:hypothetical protein
MQHVFHKKTGFFKKRGFPKKTFSTGPEMLRTLVSALADLDQIFFHSAKEYNAYRNHPSEHGF